MSGWWVPVAATLILGMAATLYVRLVRLPREEIAAGIAALPSLRWRDFLKLVLAALQRMGFQSVPDPDDASDGSEVQLERDGERWLLSAKHGASYVLGPQQIREFARAMEIKGARGGLLVTPGTFATDATAAAAQHGIELFDGKRLWPEVEPLLDAQQRSQFIAAAHQRATHNVVASWLMALVIGIGFALWMSRARLAAPPDPSKSTAAIANHKQPKAAALPTASSAPTTNLNHPIAPISTASIPTDPAELAQRRKQLVDAIATLATVQSVRWSSESNLVVHLSDTGIDAKTVFCPLLGNYPELRSSRLQLQPPDGSEQLVRFVQCWTY